MELPKVIKVGNSKCIAIPHRFCKKLGIRVGQHLECTINTDGDITIKPHIKDETKA